MLREGDCLLLVEVQRQRELFFAKHKKPSAILMQRAILDQLVDVMPLFIIHIQLNQRLRTELFLFVKELMNNRLDVFFPDDIESLGEVIVATCELLVKLKDVVHSTKDTRAR